VLVVEDDPHIRELVLLHLGLEGLDDRLGRDGTEGLRIARSRAVRPHRARRDAAGLDGVTVCRAIRREPHLKDVPILMLTARREESDKVNGLESGADDYLTKPFGDREFVARVRALLRGGGPRANASAHRRPCTGRLHVDPARRLRASNDRDVELTAHEFDLLYVLASNRGIVFSRDALVQRVWGGDTHITERSVDTLVKRLRKKIEDDPPSRATSRRCGARATSSSMPESSPAALVSQPLLAHRARATSRCSRCCCSSRRTRGLADGPRVGTRQPDAGGARRLVARDLSDEADAQTAASMSNARRATVRIRLPAVRRACCAGDRRVFERAPTPPNLPRDARRRLEWGAERDASMQRWDGRRDGPRPKARPEVRVRRTPGGWRARRRRTVGRRRSVRRHRRRRHPRRHRGGSDLTPPISVTFREAAPTLAMIGIALLRSAPASWHC
jgi:DNA-binding response OmpR family regulator